MFAVIKSIGIFGMESYIIEVETDISGGLPAFDIVGLPDAAVKESRNRVRSALKNCGYKFPSSRITVNLAPADHKKEGSVYDLPIAISVLQATKQINADLKDCAFIGELALNGALRGVNGILAMVITAKQNGITKFFMPKENVAEATVIDGIEIYGVSSLQELKDHLDGFFEIPVSPYRKVELNQIPSELDFSEVKGQFAAKYAMEVAAAGGHNILLIGTPGSGKSMLAKRLPTILPEMTFDESIETTKIYSIAGKINKKDPFITLRPFRSPHHTISTAGFAGGGTVPKPGEISLSHNGILFLDELPEFDRGVLESLRQPLEDGVVTISRAVGSCEFPSKITLVTAMNPCPCGFFGHPTKPCSCSKATVRRYLNRVSGPLLDRIDLQIEVPPVDYNSLSSTSKEESSEEIRKRVNNARQKQIKRFAGTSVTCNANMPSSMIRKYCTLTEKAEQVLKTSFENLGFSARAYDRILKVARTVADLDNADVIDFKHIAKAIQFRSLDRKYWGEE